MNEFVIYVLYSPSTGRTYTGFTSDLINRMQSHNQFGTKGFTLRFRPWIVIYIDFFEAKNANRNSKPGKEETSFERCFRHRM